MANVPIPDIGRYMLKHARQFIIDNKRIFKTAFIKLAETYPEPTRENVTKKNTLVFLDIRDKFLKYCNFSIREFNAMWKVSICEYEHDPDYDSPLTFIIEEV